MVVLDCLGDFCPVPLLSAAAASKKIKPGDSVMIVTDHSCALESIRDYFTIRPFDLLIDEVLNGVWEVTISKKC